MFDNLVELAITFDIVVCVGWLALLLYNARELSSYSRYRLPNASSTSKELVSVIIPARNEEATIGACVDSVLGQTHGNLEVIVVDDESTDGTAKVVEELSSRDSRVRLLRGATLPQDWVGKNWACEQGCLASKGVWLLFVDSDSVLAPVTVGAALSCCAERSLEALSIFPRVELRGFWARTVWPATSAMIRLLYPPRSINDPRGRSALVFGTFVMIKRNAYEQIGGHRAVRDEMVEDKEIGRNLKAQGIPYAVLIGRSELRAGLATGANGIWEAVRRIVSNPVRRGRPLGGIFAVALFALFVYPLLLPLLIENTPSQGTLVGVALISVLAPTAIVAYDVRNTTRPSYLFCFLAAIGGVTIMVAILRALTGRSRPAWRGRTYKPATNETV